MQDCGPFILPDCANDIAALAEHLDLTDLHIMGHSMGGYLSLMLADLIPTRLASLTLLTSAATNGHRNFILFQHALKLYQDPNMPAGFWLRNLFPWLMSPSFFADPNNLDNAINASLAYPFAQTAASVKLQIKALTGFQNRDPKKPLPCCAQAILGDRDLLFPEPDARAALAPIPDLEIHTIKDAAHSIHWEQPADVAKALITFTNA
jgi:pimeloyl-ACP methyl ester carboxylesterase